MVRCSVWLAAIIISSLTVPPATAQHADEFRIKSEMLYEVAGKNRRTAEPWEIRAYPGKADGKTPDRAKGPVWVGTPSKPEYKIRDGEVPAFHSALDLSSYGPDGKPAPIPFKAGVYGTVIRARGDDGFIAVQLADGNIIQYLHTSKASVKPGQEVTPDTLLGVTGDVGTKLGNYHLHIQAVNNEGKAINVDRAFLEGRDQRLDRTIKRIYPKWVDVGPLVIDTKKPKVGPDGVVKADAANYKVYFDDDAPKGGKPLEEKYSVVMYQEGKIAAGPFSHYKSLDEATKSARAMVSKTDRKLGIKTEVRDSSGKVVAGFSDGQGDK